MWEENFGTSAGVHLIEGVPLTTVPTKYRQGFYARLGPHEEADLCKGYWNQQRKIGVAMHFFEIISLESQ